MRNPVVTITLLLVMSLGTAHVAADAPGRGVGVRLKTPDGKEVDLYSASYALVIGASDYRSWPKLPGVKSDVEAVAAELTRIGFEVQIVNDPTRSGFDQAMASFIAAHGDEPNNRLLFYFAGHGHTITTGDGRQLGYIVPIDAPLPSSKSAFKGVAISMDEVEIYAKQIEAKHALFIFDSCFSGSLFEPMRGYPDAISAKTAKPVRQFITAGTADQQVPDQSIFRSQLIEGLEGAADLNHDGYITGTELGEFLQDTVTNYSHRTETPEYGKIRYPNLDKGDFVFVLPSATVPAHEAPPVAMQGRVPDLRSVELEFWNSIRDETDPDYFKDYLHRYPDGMFASIASVRLRNLTTTPASANTRPAPDPTNGGAVSGVTSPALEAKQKPATMTEAAARTPAAPGTDTATVVIYRVKSLVGMALSPIVMLDGKILINVANGTAWKGTFEPGHHLFEIDDKRSKADLDLVKGETYYMRVDIVRTMWSGRGSLTRVTAQQGASDSKDLKLFSR